MSRRRDLSTDISTDGKVNELSNLAALLYTWSIPHANEDASLTPKTAKEIKMLIIPGRDCTIADVQGAMEEVLAQGLWLKEESGVIYFPPETFYKYQNKIAADRRRSVVVKEPIASAEPRNPTKPHETPQMAAHCRAEPQNPVSSSFSSSSLSFSDPALRAGSSARAREASPLMDDIGLGDKHPSVIAGPEAWQRWLAHLKSRGKVASIIQTELYGKRLLELKARGNDPSKVIDKTIRAGLVDFIELPEKERSAEVVEFVDALELKRRAQERAVSA